MVARNESIALFKSFARRGKAGKVLDREFKKALRPLTEEVSRGFNNEEISTLVEALTTVPLTLPKFSSLIRVIIPVSTVPENAFQRMAMWACTHHQEKKTCAILVLQWISAVLEHELADKSHVEVFFELFFGMLRNPSVEKDACKLVYALVRPEVVSRWRVNSVLLLHERNQRKRHTNSLLMRFKSLRPELLPENVAAHSEVTGFKRTSALFAGNMEAAAERRQRLGGAGPDDGGLIVWGKLARSKERRGMGFSKLVDCIPAVTTLQLSSALRRNKQAQLSLLGFSTLPALCRYQLSVPAPAQALSLLDNSAGLHMLAFGSTELQRRFSDTLFYKLSALLREPSAAPYKRAVLEQLVALQETMQQGLAVVAVVIAEFLQLWNGDDFHPQIYKLLERATFMSIQELDELIFRHLHRFFVQGDYERKCLIVDTMTRFMQNSFLSSWRRRRGLPPLFVAAETDGRDDDLTLTLAAAFVGRLCAAGLAVSREQTLLLDRCLGFYETVSIYEADSGLPVWTVMPPAVFYRALFSRNLHFASRALDLLLRNATQDVRRVRLAGAAADFADNVATVTRYAADARNALRDGKALTNRSAGWMFRDVDVEQLSRYGTMDEMDEAFLPPNNQAFAPFLIADAYADVSQNWKKQADALLPQLGSLLSATERGWELD